MTTKLDRFTQKARAEPETRFNALMGLVLDPEGLHASCVRQKGNKAPGVDGILSIISIPSLVDDSNWEPDGVTLQVRFYEGPVTNRYRVEILWHRRETRRQLRTRTSTYVSARTRSTLRVDRKC